MPENTRILPPVPDNGDSYLYVVQEKDLETMGYYDVDCGGITKAHPDDSNHKRVLNRYRSQAYRIQLENPNKRYHLVCRTLTGESLVVTVILTARRLQRFLYTESAKKSPIGGP